jgi:hypothetical protein
LPAAPTYVKNYPPVNPTINPRYGEFRIDPVTPKYLTNNAPVKPTTTPLNLKDPKLTVPVTHNDITYNGGKKSSPAPVSVPKTAASTPAPKPNVFNLPAQSLNPNSQNFKQAAMYGAQVLGVAGPQNLNIGGVAALAKQATNSTQATNVSESRQAQQATQYRMPQESEPHR